ncbi:hypothetical protein FC96_GL001872 [Secundilactobacillus kimchicus JCM 15530]|uniref:Uncharacterized protein n=1 Tax=Secundilactobacillus kimchicus JCM 15530 TaxID=1302272 RepID=A0A0R1HNN8_9LACO|nr:hypothetical protein FC96_GL001872 [Secundilactobacillus kimchicus JCM 15530]
MVLLDQKLMQQFNTLLKWYRDHGYLLEADSEQGDLFRLVDTILRKAFQCLPNQLQPIFVDYYVQHLNNIDLFDQLAISRSQFYTRKQAGIEMLVEIVGQAKLSELSRKISAGEVVNG